MAGNGGDINRNKEKSVHLPTLKGCNYKGA